MTPPWRSVALAVAVVTLCLSTTHAARVWTVFVVDSYHASYPWSRECRQGLLDGLGKDVRPVFFEMDTKRRPASEFPARADAAWDACAELAPDVVVLMDDNAVRYLGERMSAAGLPVVFMGVNNNPRKYFSSQRIPANVSGVLERALVLRFMNALGEILDYAPRRVLLLMDESQTSEAMIETSLGGHREMVVSGIEMAIFQTANFSAWREYAQGITKDNYDAVILGSCGALKDDEGRQVPLDDVSGWSARAVRVPVFGLWDIVVGKGKAIGSLLVNGSDQGRVAAGVVNGYLSSGRMPPIGYTNRASMVFSRYELDRWGIELPDDVLDRASFVD